MGKKEMFVKHLYNLISIISDVFLFYIFTIGILALYVFANEQKLQEVLNLTFTYKFYITVFAIYIPIKGLKSLLFLQTIKFIEWDVCSVIGIILLSFVGDNPYKIMCVFLAICGLKLLIILFVKFRYYPTECIGYVIRKHTVDDDSENQD